MKSTLIFLISLCIFPFTTDAQNMLTRKEIYRIYCKTVVQIYVDGHFSGAGFLASSDGTIMTANHVVTTRESGFRQYSGNIKVSVNGNDAPYPATPVHAQISDDQVNYDSAIIKIEASQLPHVTLGSWDEFDLGDTVTLISSWPGMGCIMLEGLVANKTSFITVLGPKPVNTILFQSPVRNGFSGSPIFSSKGHVIGIVDTKVFGISESLSALRDKWMATRSQGSMAIMGVDVSGSFLELINNLDQNLISGLGTGVAIQYAKQQTAN
jgi:S1-C subfamily serine protease